MSIRFTQSCPTCGRRIQVQASLLGHSIACPHCRAEFVAFMQDGNQAIAANQTPNEATADPLMIRVEKALARASAAQTVIS